MPVCFEGLDRDREAVSENATRNIFGWLRPYGHAPNEVDIWKHYWFQIYDSDDDEVSGDSAVSRRPQQPLIQVKTWLASLESDGKWSEKDDDDAADRAQHSA